MIYIKIITNSLIARLAAKIRKADKIAVVTGSTIRLYNCSKGNFLTCMQWLRHEVMHVKQYRQLGYMRFLFAYFVDYYQNGYYHNRFEHEARAAEKDGEILNDVIIL